MNPKTQETQKATSRISQQKDFPKVYSPKFVQLKTRNESKDSKIESIKE